MTTTPTDPLTASIGTQSADLIRTAEAVRQAAAFKDLSTLERAGALVELADLNRRLDELLDRLHGFVGVLAEDPP